MEDAMPVMHAVVLGIVQGLTEVLPISSSGHLVLIPWIFNWKYQGLSFDVALHIGTAAAFGAYFFKDWVDMLRAKNRRMLGYLILATIPGGLAGMVLEKKAETVFRAPLVIAVMLFVFAVVLWASDRYGKKQKDMGQTGLKDALAIGLSQILALIPGVSRSGITITAGLFQGLTREAAAKFSFLLATPIVFAAGALKLHKLSASDLTAAFWAGVVSSALAGILSIHFFLRFVKKASLNVFVIYRILAALAVLACVLGYPHKSF